MDPWGKIGHLTKSEIRDLQNRKLQQFINQYLYPFSPYYRRLFDQNKIKPGSIRTVADLRQIPFCSKKDFIDPDRPDKIKDFIQQPDLKTIRQFWPKTQLLKLKWQSLTKGDEFVKVNLEKEFRPCFITFTTGTTNMPVSFLYTSHDIQNLHVSGHRMLKLTGMQSSDHVVNMFPYAPHLAFWQVVFGGLEASTLILSTGGGKMMGTEGNIRALLKMKPSVLLGVPSYIYHVLRAAKEQGVKLETIKKVILGASRVSTAFKVRLAELLASMGAKDVCVFGTYGFTEARSAWAECPTPNDISSGYHLYPDKEIFEVIDPKTGEVKGEGEDGELVYSSIDSRGSSVLRYRTGDYVKGGITYEPCKYSGLTVPRINYDITRISDVKDYQASKVKGCLVDFNNFSSCLSEFTDIEEWQIELNKKDNDPFEVDQMVVYLSARPGCQEAALADTVRSRLAATTEVTPNEVKFIPFAEMIKRLGLETENKERRIVDKRPKE